MTTTSATKTTRSRKTAIVAPDTEVAAPTSHISSKSVSLFESFTTLLAQITQVKDEFEHLQKEITDTKNTWIREKQEYSLQLSQHDQEETLKRKREEETYQYETSLSRRKEEDAFSQKKASWEQTLQESKDVRTKELKELEQLRGQVAGFETDKTKAIKEACTLLEQRLTQQYSHEKKLREQEVKAERDLLQLKIENLTKENTQQAKEILALKLAFDEATRQVKDIAVRVIDSTKPTVVKSSSET